MGRRRVLLVGGVAAVASALALGFTALAVSDDEDAGERPLITLSEAWDFYPTAQVVGDLALRHDCLLLDGEVVFWPQGTGWDSSVQR
jgi:hypothetical protein